MRESFARLTKTNDDSGDGDIDSRVDEMAELIAKFRKRLVIMVSKYNTEMTQDHYKPAIKMFYRKKIQHVKEEWRKKMRAFKGTKHKLAKGKNSKVKRVRDRKIRQIRH